VNWYRVLTQHDNFKVGDIVLLPGGEREASLEQRGYLRFAGVEDPSGVAPQPPQVQPEFLTEEPSTKDEATKPKRGRRGKQVEAGPPESEPVEPVPGDEARGEDRPAD
jgi:hypothetical protein